MSSNPLNILMAKLTPGGQQRLLQFLDGVDTDTAARLRHWLGLASDAEVSAAAGYLNRGGDGRQFAAWWSSRDHAAPASTPALTIQPHSLSSVPHFNLRTHTRWASGGNRDLRVGSAWLAGGLLVTVVTYALAVSSPMGGHFIIAWGAMLYGGARILRGLKYS